MDSPSELAEYLRQNLRYELLMLRFTHSKTVKPMQQLDWNAYFESFAVHARILYYFLTNGDNKNRRATEYGTQFRARPTNDVTSALTKINPQILHLGPGRSSDSEEKANLENARKLIDWIEVNFRNFIGGLGNQYTWDWGLCDPGKFHTHSNPGVQGPTGPAAPGTSSSNVTGPTGPAGPTTTNAPTSSYTTIVP